MIKNVSPLRYPGGKLKVVDYIKRLLEVNDLVGGTYIEPYAGGASVSLSLLFEGGSEGDYDFMFAANLQQTMEEAFNDRTEKYKQERDTYKVRYEELKYDIKVAQLQAKYQAADAQLKVRKDRPAKDGIIESHPEPAFTVKEIVAYVKENFSKSGADEISALLYRLAAEHHYLEGDVLNLIGVSSLPSFSAICTINTLNCPRYSSSTITHNILSTRLSMIRNYK